MTRQVNTLTPLYYTGAGPAWRGGERRVIVFWKGKALSRMLDLCTLGTLVVKTDTLCHPYTRPWEDSKSLRASMKVLAAKAQIWQKAGVNLPLETIGAIIVAAKKAKYTPGDCK